MDILSFIIWAPEPEIFPNVDWIKVRWYGLMFAMGFIISQQIMYYIYRKDGRPEKDVDVLTIYMIIATILGARLGHVLFYEPDKYLANPLNILKIWEGGLASHGGAFGILTALYLFTNYHIDLSKIYSPFKGKWIWKKKKREKQSFLWVVDRVVIVVALTGCLIRLGNFMNSEIIGKPIQDGNGVFFAHDVKEVMKHQNYVKEVSIGKTENPKPDEQGRIPVYLQVEFTPQVNNQDAVLQVVESRLLPILKRYDYLHEHIAMPENLKDEYNIVELPRGLFRADIFVLAIPRHPAQLYESISSFLLFVLLFLLWFRYRKTMKEGWIFGIFLIILFGLRFLYEFLKENQVAFEETLPLNMGQWLSIPLILAGVFILLNLNKLQPKDVK